MQLPSGETINGVVPAGMSDDDVKSYVRLKRPDLFGPPAGIPAPPKPRMEYSNESAMREAGLINPETGQMQGLEHGAGTMMSPQTGPSAAGAAFAGSLPLVGAAALGGRYALPVVKQQAAKYPWAAQAIGSALISNARQIPGVGKYIPPYAEWLPFLIGGSSKGEKTPAPGEPELLPPSTDQSPGRPYKPNPRYEPPPEPEPMPQRNGPLLLKGEVQKPTSMGKLPWVPELEKSLGNQPYQVKPGVPIRQQGLPAPARESSAIQSFHYEPEAREFHVLPKGGQTGYVYGDVNPEDAQAFANADSKGQAWQQMKRNPLVGKMVNGKRVAVKPSTSSADPNDLTDILTRSLQQSNAAKQ